MYKRNFYLTLPLVILASGIAVAVAQIPSNGFQSPDSGYTYEEPSASVRLVNEIADEVKKWVLPDQGLYQTPSSGPQQETVSVQIKACEPVTDYITKRISDNVMVRTHCMLKSVYRHPNKRELMHQSSQCRGHLCNPQPLSDPYNSEPTFLQLPVTMGADPLASIFSNIMDDYNNYDYPENVDYTLPDYSYNVDPDPLAVDNIEYPAYDYIDANTRQRSLTYSPPTKQSGKFLVKGKLLHSDRNVDLSDPNFGLPDILFRLDNSIPKQLDRPNYNILNRVYSDPKNTEYTVDYVYELPAGDNFRSAVSDIYETPVDTSLRSGVSDLYETPIDDSFRSGVSDVYATPVDENTFRAALSDSAQNPTLLSNNQPTDLSNIPFNSPTFLIQYNPNYTIPPGSQGLDLSHDLRVTLSGADNIPITSTIVNGGLPQFQDFGVPRMETGIPIPTVVPNNGLNQGFPSSQGNPAPIPPQTGIPIPNVVQNNGLNQGFPSSQGNPAPITPQTGIPIPNVVPNNGLNQGFPSSQGNTAPITPQTGIPIPNVVPNNGLNQGFPSSQGNTAPITPQTGIPIPKLDSAVPNNSVNQGFPLSQGSSAPNQSPGSPVGIPIPKIDNTIPSNGVNQGFPPSESFTPPSNPQIGLNNPGSPVGIPIPKIDNAIANNGVNQGFGLSQGSIAPNNPQIGNNNPGSPVGIPIPKLDNPTPNSGINQGFPLSQGSIATNNNNPGSMVGIPIPKIDNAIPNNGVNQGFSMSQGSMAPSNPQIVSNNPSSQVGIPIPKFDHPIPNNPKFDHPVSNHGLNSGIPTSKDSVVPANNQIGNPNPNSPVGIPIPTLDQPIPNSGLSGDLSLSQGSIIPIDSQNSIPNFNPGVGIPIPNNGVNANVLRSQDSTVRGYTPKVPNSPLQTGILIPKIDNTHPNNDVSRDLSLSQGLTVPIGSPIAIPNSNSGFRIPIPSGHNPTTNNNANIGIPISQGPTVPVDALINIIKLHNPDFPLGIPIVPSINNPIQGFPFSPGSTASNSPQTSLNNPRSQVGIPIPKLDNAAPNNVVDQGFPLSQGAAAPNNPQLGLNNPGSTVGIPIPKLDNAVPSNGINQGFPLSQGSVASNNPQIGLNNPGSMVGIPIPKLDNVIPMNQGPPSSFGPMITNPNSNSGLGISLPGGEQPFQTIGKMLGMPPSVVGVPIPTPSGVLVGPQIANPNSALGVGISLPGGEQPLQNIDMMLGMPPSVVGIPIPTISGVLVGPQASNGNPGADFGLSLSSPISNSDANQGINMLNEAIIIVDSHGTITKADAPLGIPLSGVNNPGANIGVSRGIPSQNNGPSVGLPIPNVDGNGNNPSSNNGVTVGLPNPNNDVNIGIAKSQPSATQNIVNNANAGVGIPIPPSGNPTSNNGGSVGIPIPKSDNTFRKYPYGYPNQIPNIATITALNLSPIPLDFLKSSTNTRFGVPLPSAGKPSPSYDNPFNVKFSPSQNNYVAKASHSYKGPSPEQT